MQSGEWERGGMNPASSPVIRIAQLASFVASNDFVFDNEMVAQIFCAGYEICEITCPTKYSEDSSSISAGKQPDSS